jgi:hypothetical protein
MEVIIKVTLKNGKRVVNPMALNSIIHKQRAHI